jgi:hypothetical protein
VTGDGPERILEEARVRMRRTAEALEDLAGDDASWRQPLHALLAMVDEVAAGAGALAAGEAPDGDGAGELAAALDDLQRAVAGLAERLATLGASDPSPTG